jgi:hypothetical protein
MITFATTAKGELHRSFAARLAASFRRWGWPALHIIADAPVDGCEAIIARDDDPGGRGLKIRFARHLPEVEGNVFFIDADCEAYAPFKGAPEVPPGSILGAPTATFRREKTLHRLCSAGLGFHSKSEAAEFGRKWWETYRACGLPTDEFSLFRLTRPLPVIPYGSPYGLLPGLRHHHHAALRGKLPGMCDFEDLYRLAVDAAPPGAHMVECGVWRGRSLAILAAAGEAKNLRVTGYDLFSTDGHLGAPLPGLDSDSWLAMVKADTARLSPANPPDVIRSDSASPAANHADGSVFFAFLDGDHTEAGLAADIRAWLPKIAPGGILAGHDLDHPRHPGVRAALGKSRLAWQPASRSSWIVRL